MPVAPSGWYDDPEGRHQSRFWDGANWTSRVASDGVESAEAMPDPPGWYKLSRFGTVRWSATPPVEGWVRDGLRWVDPAKPRPEILRRWDGLSVSGQLLIIAGLVIVVAVPLVALSGGANGDRNGDEEPSRLSLPTSSEIGDMTCVQLNGVVDRTGVALGFNPDGSVSIPSGLTAADARRIRVVLDDVERRVEILGGCAEQPNFAGP